MPAKSGRPHPASISVAASHVVARIEFDSGQDVADDCPMHEIVRLKDRDARNEFERRRYEVVVAPVAYHVRVGVVRKEDRVVINGAGWFHMLRTSL